MRPLKAHLKLPVGFNELGILLSQLVDSFSHILGKFFQLFNMFIVGPAVVKGHVADGGREGAGHVHDLINAAVKVIARDPSCWRVQVNRYTVNDDVGRLISHVPVHGRREKEVKDENGFDQIHLTRLNGLRMSTLRGRCQFVPTC